MNKRNFVIPAYGCYFIDEESTQIELVDYLQTHYQIVAEIEKAHEQQNTIIVAAVLEGGIFAKCDLAQAWTDEFISLHTTTNWGLEEVPWADQLWIFVGEKLKGG